MTSASGSANDPATAIGFERLYRAHFAHVLAFLARRGCPRLLRDDLAQEVFVRAWQQRAKFRDVCRPDIYLFGIARNVMREALRSNRLKDAKIQRLDFDPATLTPGFAMDQQELGVLLEQIKQRLSQREWQALELTCIQDLSLNQAAFQANCDLPAFYSRLSRARRKIAKLSAVLEKS